MHVTDYAFENLTFSTPANLGETLSGAAAHAATIAHDTGERFVLTGKDASGRRIRREARSLSGAYAVMVAAWGFNRAWHVRPDGTRRLAITR